MMHETITSNQNKWIKHLKSLQLKKYRELHDEYIVEGIKLLNEALIYDVPMSFVLFNECVIKLEEVHALCDRCMSANIPVYITEEKVFLEASETNSPQGVIAVVRKQSFALNSVLNKERLNLVILDSVQDPGNVGTIIRTADACNMDAVILSKGSVDIYNGKTVRSTMGSLFHIPIIVDADIIALLQLLNNQDVHTIGGDISGNEDCFKLPAYEKIAIVIGNESKGMSDEVRGILKHRVSIPMPGKSESLNAAIAAALLMYEIAVRKHS